MGLPLDENFLDQTKNKIKINNANIIISLYLLIYPILYGTVSNIFIDYISLTIFICSYLWLILLDFMEKKKWR